jgi:hypothetical protein
MCATISETHLVRMCLIVKLQRVCQNSRHDLSEIGFGRPLPRSDELTKLDGLVWFESRRRLHGYPSQFEMRRGKHSVREDSYNIVRRLLALFAHLDQLSSRQRCQI